MDFSHTNPIAVWHTQPCYYIQCGTADVGFSDLGVKAACLELTTEQGLEPADSRLGQTAPMGGTLLPRQAAPNPFILAGTFK